MTVSFVRYVLKGHAHEAAEKWSAGMDAIDSARTAFLTTTFGSTAKGAWDDEGVLHGVLASTVVTPPAGTRVRKTEVDGAVVAVLVPDRRRRAGRDLADQYRAFKYVKPEAVGELLGCGPKTAWLTTGADGQPCFAYLALLKVGTTWFASFPSGAGVQPPSELVEPIKEWQYLKALDESGDVQG